MLLRKLAENPNEHGEGARAVAIADALLDIALRIRTSSPAAQDALLKSLDAQLKVLHEASGKPQERVEHSANAARTINVRPLDHVALPPVDVKPIEGK